MLGQGDGPPLEGLPIPPLLDVTADREARDGLAPELLHEAGGLLVGAGEPGAAEGLQLVLAGRFAEVQDAGLVGAGGLRRADGPGSSSSLVVAIGQLRAFLVGGGSPDAVEVIDDAEQALVVAETDEPGLPLGGRPLIRIGPRQDAGAHAVMGEVPTCCVGILGPAGVHQSPVQAGPEEGRDRCDVDATELGEHLEARG